MPHRKLPLALVKKLERAGGRLLTDKRFGRWENVDHASWNPKLTIATGKFKPTVNEWGGRVRLLKLKEGRSPVLVVVKKVHTIPAKETIELVNDRVSEFNKEYKSSKLILLPARAYPISEWFVAMAYTNRPSLGEIFKSDHQTERGVLFFEKLQKKHRVSLAQLEDAAEYVTSYSGISKSNLLLIGIRQGKFVFVPLVDYY